MYVFFIYLTIAMPIQRIVTTTQKITKRVPIELMAYDMFRGKKCYDDVTHYCYFYNNHIFYPQKC